MPQYFHPIQIVTYGLDWKERYGNKETQANSALKKVKQNGSYERLNLRDVKIIQT